MTSGKGFGRHLWIGKVPRTKTSMSMLRRVNGKNIRGNWGAAGYMTRSFPEH